MRFQNPTDVNLVYNAGTEAVPWHLLYIKGLLYYQIKCQFQAKIVNEPPTWHTDLLKTAYLIFGRNLNLDFFEGYEFNTDTHLEKT